MSATLSILLRKFIIIVIRRAQILYKKTKEAAAKNKASIERANLSARSKHLALKFAEP
jgi:hypothetical protein